MARIARLRKRKALLKRLVESKVINFCFIIMTLWSLFSEDVRYASTSKGEDVGIDAAIVIMTFLFLVEIATNCYATEDYFHLPDWHSKQRLSEPHWKYWLRRVQFGSFSFFLDILAALSYILQLSLWPGLVVPFDNAYLQLYHRVGIALRAGARASRVIVFIRSIKWYKLWDKVATFFHLKAQTGLNKIKSAASYSTTSTRLSLEMRDELRETLAELHNAPTVKGATKKGPTKGGDEEEESTEKSRVGAAMNYLMNQRVIVLVILMLVCVTLLTAVQKDEEFALTTRMVQTLAAANASNPALYGGALLSTTRHLVATMPVLSIQIGATYLLNREDVISARRSAEIVTVAAGGGGGGSVAVKMVFDNFQARHDAAVSSMTNTAFLFGVLVIGLYFMTTDVNKLIINPIERLVDLVRKISANPLGVEYKMLGEKEGFMPGMETTILLTTINRIGSLMQVGLGSRPLSHASPRLTLLSASTPSPLAITPLPYPPLPHPSPSPLSRNSFSPLSLTPLPHPHRRWASARPARG